MRSVVILWVVDELRRVCAIVAERASSVRIEHGSIEAYAASLPVDARPPDDGHPRLRDREQLAAFWLELDAINFGSGWFPTLRKRAGYSGYGTIAAALQEHAVRDGPWSAAQLTELDTVTVAQVLGQRAEHELMALYARALNDLGGRVRAEFDGAFGAVADAAGGSAVTLAARLGEWPCFADSSRYDELEIPFLKRAQIAAADLHRAGVTRFDDLARLTMFADNLVPHVLRLDGVLSFDPDLLARIDRGELIVHGSPEEVEIRACAVHVVELIVTARPRTTAPEVDQLLWLRGSGLRYKSSPRHRSRCTAY